MAKKRKEDMHKQVDWGNLYPYKVNFSDKLVLERVGYMFELIYRAYEKISNDEKLYLGSIWVKIVKGEYVLMFPNNESERNLKKLENHLKVWFNGNLPTAE